MHICIILPPAPGLFDPRTNVPLGPLYVAAVLEQEGHSVTLISLLGHDVPAIWPKADLYAMGFTTPQVSAARGIMELIRSQHPDAKVLAAGAHPTALPAETLHLGFDSVLIGEGEGAILTIIGDLPRLKKTYLGVPIMDLDSIPYPARHLLPHEDIHNKASAVFREDEMRGHIAGIMTSRGCPGRCSFCSNHPSQTRYRSAKNVVGEMRELSDLDITYFKLQDDTFTLSPSRVAGLADEIEREFGHDKIKVRIITRVDAFSADKFAESLKRMSVDVVSFGIESGSQKILDLNNKGITIQRAQDAIRSAKDHGFRVFGYFMFGLPGECAETVEETIEFWKRNRSCMDVAVLSFFIPYPGTAIASCPSDFGMHIIESDWNKYWTVQKRTVMALPYDVSFEEMLKLKDRALDAFEELGYARPEWRNDR